MTDLEPSTTITSTTPTATGRLAWVSPRRRALIAITLTIAGLLAVVARDITRIDQTSGGYDAPYDDVSGEPIDWLALRVTETGFRDTGGWMINSSLDCTTGQIRFHVGPVTVDYRALSERAIVVHRPQDACRQVGFEPQWSEPEWAVAAADTTRTGGSNG